MGLTAICACLIGLVATIVHQTRNTFSVKEHWLWCYWVILLGSLTIIFGIYVLISSDASARLAPGIILICLGMIDLLALNNALSKPVSTNPENVAPQTPEQNAIADGYAPDSPAPVVQQTSARTTTSNGHNPFRN